MARDITKLHPELQILLKKLQDTCAKQGLKIGIGECVRTVAEQDALYAKGRTAPGGIVTNARGSTYSSMHQWGVAFDFYRNDGKGAYNDSDGFFTKVGKIGQSLGLEWGGVWKSIVDKPHFQLPNWGSTPSKLKTQYGTPDKFMASWNISTPAKETKNDWVARLQKLIGVKVDNIAGPKTLAATPSIKRGDRGEAVKLVQEKLVSLGYDLGKYGPNKDGVDGIFGAALEKAIKDYQRNVVKLLRPDGVMESGKRTWKTMLGL